MCYVAKDDVELLVPFLSLPGRITDVPTVSHLVYPYIWGFDFVLGFLFCWFLVVWLIGFGWGGTVLVYIL